MSYSAHEVTMGKGGERRSSKRGKAKKDKGLKVAKFLAFAPTTSNIEADVVIQNRNAITGKDAGAIANIFAQHFLSWADL